MRGLGYRCFDMRNALAVGEPIPSHFDCLASSYAATLRRNGFPIGALLHQTGIIPSGVAFGRSLGWPPSGAGCPPPLATDFACVP
jgi:hypothetical protein